MANTPERAPAPEVRPAPKPRNLTYDNLLRLVKAQMASALEAIPSYEAVEVSVTERDAKGNAILKNGFPSLTKQAVLKRDVEALKWQPKIDELYAMGAQD
jgi:hypothetical protein